MKVEHHVSRGSKGFLKKVERFDLGDRGNSSLRAQRGGGPGTDGGTLKDRYSN